MQNQQIDIRTFQYFDSFKRRFLAKIPKECFLEGNEDICWNWIGVKHQRDYGQITWNGIKYSSHRTAYIIFKGLIPDNQLIRHTCNNRHCVNPKHLISGTYGDNLRDMFKANAGGMQKLSLEAIKEIKHALAYEPKRGLIKKLAKQHNVGQTAISHIKLGNTWSWVKI